MWIYTLDGHFSVVQEKGKRKRLIVRARLRDHIGNFRERFSVRGRILITPDADYPFRMFVAPSVWAKALMTWANDINYDNFKAAVHDLCGLPTFKQYEQVYLAAARCMREPIYPPQNVSSDRRKLSGK